MTYKGFTMDTFRRDAFAGSITGLVAIPLTVGICLMSEYPIQTGLITVIFACFVSYISYLFKPGNYIGTPGIAAGLAPVLALGVHEFGMQNMSFIIFMTALFQAIIWKYDLQKFILKIVPHYLVEGLLAGVGLKIALKFLPYTYEAAHQSTIFWDKDRIQIVLISVATMLLFLYLFSKFKVKSPGIPYIVVIATGVWLSLNIELPMLHIDHVPFTLSLPWENVGTYQPLILLQMAAFALMLSSIDVIEQVMSNAAIEKIDPYNRKCNTNNSLLAIWLSNMGSSFFGGMTNLDGLAKSTTNKMAGAITKLSNLFTAAVLLVFVLDPQLLTYLPEYSLAVLMVFTGWKMIAGVFHVAAEGKYAFMLSLFCGILVFEAGIFEGLLYSLAVHGFINYVIYRHHKMPFFTILKNFLARFVDDVHPHSDATMNVVTDEHTGGLRYSSIQKIPADKKSLNNFIEDWGASLNSHNVLNVVGNYDYDAMLWGTFAKELRSGHMNIKKYFEHLFDLDRVKVKFESSQVRQYKDIYIQSGSYIFSFYKKSELVHINARYSFVCKKEKNGWFILEHHSSEFPS